MIKFCKNCLTLNTIGFNPIKEDICQACINYEDQNNVNWHRRLNELHKIFKKKKSNNFDCIVPVSGGKDSTFQIFKLREIGAKPLGVCIDTGHFSKIGKKNLENLTKKNLDIMIYKIPKITAHKLSKIGLLRDGDIGWSESILLNVITCNIAVKMGVKNIFWGENSAVEYGGPEHIAKSKFLNLEAYKIHSSKNNYQILKILKNYGLKKNSFYFSFPSYTDLRKLRPFYLGYFIKWDGFKNYDYAKKKGFAGHSKRVSGTILNYEHIDNYQDGIHDYFRFLKFGIGRAYDQISRMLRRKMLKLSEAKNLIKKYNGEFPKEYLGVMLEDILEEIKISKNNFRKLENKFYNKNIIIKKNGTYKLKSEFI